MCNYEGSHFGASYPDACCIDGRLWDLDSCDEPGGDLFSGGDIPCPECETEAYLYGDLEDYHVLETDGFNTISGAILWEAKVKYAGSLNRDAAIAAIKKNGPVETTDFACRKTKDWDDTCIRVYLVEESLEFATQPHPDTNSEGDKQ